MAAAVHAALLAFLWIGVSWQNNEPVSVEAEVWDMKVQDAAPPPPPPAEAVTPPPAPEPLPAPKVTPPPVEEKVAPKPPDIALEREKQRKLQREEERKERELAEREEQKRQDLADKKAREKADKLAAEKQKKKEQELADKLAEKKDAEKLLADKKKAADKAAKAKQAADDKVLKDIREADLRRMTSQASGNGTSGNVAKSTGPRLDASNQAAIAAKVKLSTNYAGDTSVPGNPRVEFVITQLPTGEIISVKKTKSSGVPAFDAAVERGINAASPLPKKKDGTVERSFPIGVAMKDLE
jgi:colicin import membrane protein